MYVPITPPEHVLALNNEGFICHCTYDSEYDVEPVDPVAHRVAAAPELDVDPRREDQGQAA